MNNNNNKIDRTSEDYRQQVIFLSQHTEEVRCINCGDIVMYANPTNFEGMQLPDMICLKCKFTITN